MKYIVFEVERPLRQRIPFVFPSLLVHAQVAEALLPMLCADHGCEPPIVSAGEVSLYSDDIQCSGGSETLGVSSLGYEDSILLRMNDYAIGFTL